MFGQARCANSALANGWPEADGADNCGGKLAGWYMHSLSDDKVALVLHNLSADTITSKRWPSENATQESILVSNGKVKVTGSVSTGTTVTLPAYSSVVFALN